MARVFLSYSRDDAHSAEQLARALAASGHEVWWDNKIHGGSRFSEEIDRALRESDVVLVLWSPAAISSAWVRDEAAEGRDADKLVPLVIRPCKPPLGFRQYHTIDLTDWSRRSGAPEALLRAIADKTGNSRDEAPEQPAVATDHIAVCVLPFANMSGDPEQEYFSDGISEDITTDLSKVSALAVTARNTAFTFKGQAVDVCELARKLRVTHVLEGSVRKAGQRVRISAQLVDGASGEHIWAERFDRDLTDIFAIQDEISSAIVEALKVKLLPQEKKAIEQRGTTSAEAYNLYLMARKEWVTGNHGDRRREDRVVRICQRAVAIDPTYARAWALMAIAQSSLRYGFNDESVDDGVVAARRALEIDPAIAEAHCPIARHFAEQGRYDEADQEFQTALRLDPDSWEVNKEAARIYFRQRRIDEATRCFEKATQLMETDFHAWGLLFSCYNAQGDQAGMRHAAEMLIQQVERALSENPHNGAALSLGAAGWAVLGQPEKAREWIERALLVDPDNLNMRYNFACSLSANLNDVEGALDMLEPVLARIGPNVVKLASNDPDLDNLRGNPRFQKMLADARARVGPVQAKHDEGTRQ